MTREQRKQRVVDILGADLATKHGKYIDFLVSSQVSPRNIAECVQWNERLEVAIATMTCSECGKPLRRYGAEQTASMRAAIGLHNGPQPQPVGGWVMYRCSSNKPPGVRQDSQRCPFMVDQFESTEAN